jgi:MFS family permease
LKKIVHFFALEKNIQGLALRNFLAYCGDSAVGALLPLYLLELGTPFVFIGVLYALMSGTGIVAGLIGGYIADRIGRKHVLLAAGYVNAFLIFSYSFAHSWEYLALLVIIEFNFATILQPALVAMIAESVSHNKRATAFSTVKTSSFGGSILGPILGGTISQLLGFGILLYVGAMFWLSSTLLAHTFLEEKYQKEKKMEKRMVGQSLSGIKRSLHIGWEPLVPIVLATIPLFGQNAANPYEAIYAQNYILINKEGVGLMYSSFNVAAGLSQVPAGKLADKVGRKKCVMLGFLLFAVGTLLFVLSSGVYQVIAVFVLLGVAQSFAVAYQVLISEKASRDRVASTWGLSMAIMGAGSSLGSLLGGTLWGFSPRAPFYFSALVNGLCAPLVVLTIKERIHPS